MREDRTEVSDARRRPRSGSPPPKRSRRSSSRCSCSRDAGQAARPACPRGGGEVVRPCGTCRRRSGALALEPHLIAWARALREEGACAVSRPRAAFPDRARGRAEAQGDLLHPRRGVSGGRAQAWTARAGRRRCRWWPSRRTTRCWRSSRSTCRKCAPRGGELYVVADPDIIIPPGDGIAPGAPAGACGTAVADRSRGSAAAACLSHGGRCAAPTSTSRATSRRA